VNEVRTGQAYERQLNSRSLREAYFLGRDTGFRLDRFLKGYVHSLPVPAQGVHVGRIALATPFKEMVDRARRAPDGYNPLKAEESYKSHTPLLAVEVTLQLTPTYPAHSPNTLPAFGRITLPDPDFWQDFDIRLAQQGEVQPLARRGRPLYDCDALGGCTLTGAVVTVIFDPEKVASRPARVYVFTPDGQRVEARFDLGRLR
jgi:hypothetical protein